ncbi:MAG: hypothetical protein AAGG69_01575, partial [Pseudomonadota bacterium]
MINVACALPLRTSLSNGSAAYFDMLRGRLRTKTNCKTRKNGAADRKDLEPFKGSSNKPNLPAEHNSLDSNFLSKTFAEMESWSDVL